KAVFIIAKVSDERQKEQEQFVIAIVRGDMEVNETKLANALKAKELRPATEEEILSAGTVPGYASPVNLKNVLVIVDDVIPKSPNLVAGANEDGFHFCNVNYGRDYSANIVTDIAAAQEGDHCPNCGSPMRSVRGVEVGNIFKLGTRYSDAVGCTFLDKDGKEKSVIMGSYGIGSGRLFACVAEEHNDNDGLLWPITIAPYHVHLVTIGENENVTNIAMELYYNLQKADIEVFFDDRKEKPGVKFKDADLIGLPIRLTVSPRSLDKNGVELKLRYSKEQVIVELSQVVSKVNSEIQLMKMEISNREIKINFDQQQ
ncbi:MAG: YbaK/EbsC family protein, partial [Desulfobacteraceae bacterium]